LKAHRIILAAASTRFKDAFVDGVFPDYLTPLEEKVTGEKKELSSTRTTLFFIYCIHMCLRRKEVVQKVC